MTIRDIDCADFDAERMAKDFHEMHVTYFSFFAGGYVTTYPSGLELQRQSPYMDGKDIVGAIVRAAHRHEIKAVAMIDLGVLPRQAALQHPDWCSVDRHGNLVEMTDGFYATCPLGGYQRDYAVRIVRELVERYDVDGIKFGGASYGFRAGVCYCRNCRDGYRRDTGGELPQARDWTDPNWRAFTRWKLRQTTACVRALMEVVRSVAPDMPVFGNSVCFGDPDWTVGSSLDVEQMANYQSAIQVEAQTRFKLDSSGEARWQSLRWTGEEARYMSSVTDKPIWVVVSYFLAWPWRRSAMSPVEQKVYLAQIAANGAMPMVNLSGGPPAVHEDPRGFRPIQELFAFHDKHNFYYDGDESAANVAIVYSLDTLTFGDPGNPRNHEHYVESIRGFEQALLDAHIPFDIVSTDVLTDEKLDRYRAIVLPSLACMSERTADAIRRYAARGGGVIATGETSLCDPDGERRGDFLLCDVFRAGYGGATLPVGGPDKGEAMQAYMTVRQPDHPLLDELGDTRLLPAAYRHCAVTALPDKDGVRASVPLTLSAPFRVFPEGLSYTTEPDTGAPMAVAAERDGMRGRGRTVYLPHAIDRLLWQTGIPDLRRLLVNAVMWTTGGDIPLALSAPATCEVSLRRKGNMLIAHLINLTGGSRLFDELVPLRDIEVAVRGAASKAHRLSDGKALKVAVADGFSRVTVDRLDDYDVVVFDMKAGG